MTQEDIENAVAKLKAEASDLAEQAQADQNAYQQRQAERQKRANEIRDELLRLEGREEQLKED
jgi:predicted  nucleic acid-binding Zn-ribbon protein